MLGFNIHFIKTKSLYVRGKCFGILLLTLLLVSFVNISHGEASEQNVYPKALDPERDLIIFMVPSFSMEKALELQLPELEKMASQGAMGLINTGVAESYHPSAAYLTLGTGARSTCDDELALALESQEKYQQATGKELYRRNLGASPAVKNGDLALIPRIPKLTEENDDLMHPVKTGGLGTKLRDEGIELKLWGNSDTDHPRRYSALVFMDQKGIIENADISQEQTLQQDSAHPFGVKSDISSYEETLEQSIQQGYEIQAYEFGDLERLTYYGDYMSQERKQELRLKYYNQINKALKSANEHLETHQIVLLNPAPTRENYFEGKRLTYMLIHPVSQQGTNLLTSDTTQRDGIIANMDFAPSILRKTGLETSSQFLGAPMEIIPENVSTNYLEDKYQSMLSTYQKRPALVQGFIFIKIFLMVLGIIAIFFSKNTIPKMDIWLLAIIISPLLFLILGGLSPIDLFPAALILILGSVGIVYLMRTKLGIIETMGLASLLVSGAVILDTFLGNSLLHASVLGHDPISGARYYGLGNEYMGILIGSTVLAIFSLGSAPKRTFSVFVLALILMLFIFSHPQLGANLGGVITTLGVLITISFIHYNEINLDKNKVNKLIIVVLGLLIIFGAIFVVINLRGDTVSHIGRTIDLVRGQGIGELYMVIVRKISMNISLIRYSVWSKVLLSFVGVLIFILLYKPGRQFDKLQHKNLQVIRALQGNVMGSIVAFVVNDSGVVAAATLLIFAVPPLLLINLPLPQGEVD
ncbi:conserved hypothetical protein [Natranaerobius thermophilus JW/NM-WN-LF]|uniref:Uncharacterized protein n=1 Tax=Natranaerobius thermophilus (strain ATCC BAA-1301 / DSM 18059 / JW/NM-WN-LF) TaxID=457570 RepID=B2A5Q4_NATTJ|nr:conserved hypothetical protein [Natranaerobius thermophilus JW/NM-WN-LF]